MHVFAWFTAGFLDLVYVLYVAGYEGCRADFNVLIVPLCLYPIIGVIFGAISWLFAVLLARGEQRANLQLGLFCWNLGLVFLVVVGLRINEIFLPAFWEPVSLAGNLGLILVALGIVGISRIVMARVSERKIRTSLAVLLFLVICVTSLLLTLTHEGSWYRFVPRDYPNVLLITLDTVRADHLGCYGYNRDTSPNLDQFARRNHLFTNCRTPMPLTSPAHATLFSGTMPHEHGVFTNLSAFPDDPSIPSITEELYENGYQTAGFPAAIHMGKQFGFDRGFLLYNQSTVLNGPSWLQGYYQFAIFAVLSRLGIIKETYLSRDSGQVNDAFLAWLDSNKYWVRARGYDNDHFFVWLHYFDAHAPYQPPEENWRRYDADYRGSVTGSQEELDAVNAHYDPSKPTSGPPEGFSVEDIENIRARYDGEIRCQDENLGDLFQGLKDRGLWDTTVIIIVSDHGEGLYDDGYVGHNFSLEEYEILTACAIKGPDITLPEDSQISLTDIRDYIRDVTGLGRVASHGFTTAPRGAASVFTRVKKQPEVSDNARSSMVYLRSHCWVEPPYKLVRMYGTEGEGVKYDLYNFEGDPSESIDIFDSTDKVSLMLRDHLNEWLIQNRADFPYLLERETALVGIDQATLEKLRSLGYIY